jgi:8-oxo-dGTP pyrophosphatase MutT (NUDIX family)
MSGEAPGPSLDEASLREPLRRVLRARDARTLPLGSRTAAAVLISLFEGEGETRVWLVRRPETMRSHGGQVAFPGGKSDPSDDSLRATALREAEEELGIPRGIPDVLGALDDYLTITGFVVTPWVAWLPPDVAVRPSAGEVARAFSPPLRTFFAPPEGILPWRGWTVEGELVWGATAAILRSFVAIIRELRNA